MDQTDDTRATTASHWRRAEPSDLAEIGRIASQVHPDLPERIDVLAEKVRLFPDGSLVLVADGAIVGYGLAHPWRLHRIPPLDDFLQELPPDADCLYLHDVAVLPAFRGRRAAASYVDSIVALARSAHIAALALVSVYDTREFWERFGFSIVTGEPALRAKLASYGESAKYMICELPRAR